MRSISFKVVVVVVVLVAVVVLLVLLVLVTHYNLVRIHTIKYRWRILGTKYMPTYLQYL